MVLYRVDLRVFYSGFLVVAKFYSMRKALFFLLFNGNRVVYCVFLRCCCFCIAGSLCLSLLLE